MSLFVRQGLPVYVIYLYHSLSLSITNSHLRHLCSKVAIHYNIVSELHASLLVVCKRYRLLPTGCLYLGWGRKCSGPSLLNVIRLSQSLPQFVMAKGNNVWKVTKTGQSGHPIEASLGRIAVNSVARISMGNKCPSYWLWHFAAQMHSICWLQPQQKWWTWMMFLSLK